MDKFIIQIKRECERNLRQIDESGESNLQKAEQSIICVRNCLSKLKNSIIKNDFSSFNAEIKFFKEIKPSIYSHLIYFMDIFRIESERPAWCLETQKTYFENELARLESFFKTNNQFYQYLNNNMSTLDHQYFKRGIINFHTATEALYFDNDPRFSTSHDYIVACLMAHTRLKQYLITHLNIATGIEQNQIPNSPNLQWTGNKIDLVELIYALHQSGSINHGKADIKELAAMFEMIFGIELGDFYRNFTNIKNRSNPTKFMDALKDALTKKIEQKESPYL